MKRIRDNYANVVSTIALVVALTIGGAAAAGGLVVTTKQIKNGTISTKDLKNNGVRSADLSNGGIQSADIGNGQVEPEDVTMPPPETIPEADTASANVGTEFSLVDTAPGTFTKDDPTSVLQVDWIGTANAPSVSCTFQIRVDGQPGGSTGLVYVANVGVNSETSVSVTGLFPGLPAGPHVVEIWARAKSGPGGTDPCIVGPAAAGIPQSFVVTEQVV